MTKHNFTTEVRGGGLLIAECSACGVIAYFTGNHWMPRSKEYATWALYKLVYQDKDYYRKDIAFPEWVNPDTVTLPFLHLFLRDTTIFCRRADI